MDSLIEQWVNTISSGDMARVVPRLVPGILNIVAVLAPGAGLEEVSGSGLRLGSKETTEPHAGYAWFICGSVFCLFGTITWHGHPGS